MAPGEDEDARGPREEKTRYEVLLGSLPRANPLILAFVRASRITNKIPCEALAAAPLKDALGAAPIRTACRVLWNRGGGMASRGNLRFAGLDAQAQRLVVDEFVVLGARSVGRRREGFDHRSHGVR